MEVLRSIDIDKTQFYFWCPYKHTGFTANTQSDYQTKPLLIQQKLRY